MIHFSFDLWSSPNNQAFLGIVGHWVDQNGCLQTAFLGLKWFHDTHTEENQAEHFLEIIHSWDILFQIGYFVLDNASNNDTAVFYIAKYLSSLNILFNATLHHLQCFEHVINLVVKAFLWGTDSDAFEKEILTENARDKEVEELIAWRKKGPMGKLHNICT